MEGLLIIIPIVITIGNCFSYCYYTHTTNRRLRAMEDFIQSLQYRQPQYHPVPPPASAPEYPRPYTQAVPEYGYQQNLNVI
jgi:hypothetical protein